MDRVGSFSISFAVPRHAVAISHGVAEPAALDSVKTPVMAAANPVSSASSRRGTPTRLSKPALPARSTPRSAPD